MESEGQVGDNKRQFDRIAHQAITEGLLMTQHGRVNPTTRRASHAHRDSAEPGAVHGPAPRVHQETDHEVSLGRRVHVATAEAAAGVRGVVVAAAAVCPRLRWKEGGRPS